MLNDYTPTEKYDNYYVKREDLACSWPGPPFAKVRGLYRGLQEIKAEGIKEVAYFETSISMATWGIGYFCKVLDMNPFVYYHRYKDGPKNEQGKQQTIWDKFEMNYYALNDYKSAQGKLHKGNNQKVNEHISAGIFKEMIPNGRFLPAGLKFDQTIEEVSKQVHNVPTEALGGSIVMCAGSGMMMAGVMSGIAELDISQDIFGVLVHSKDGALLKKFIMSRTEPDPFGIMKLRTKIVDYGYEYKQKENCEVPFPCCPYYDRKAFKWMTDNFDSLKKPILFWNIGSSYDYYTKEELKK